MIFTVIMIFVFIVFIIIVLGVSDLSNSESQNTYVEQDEHIPKPSIKFIDPYELKKENNNERVTSVVGQSHYQPAYKKLAKDIKEKHYPSKDMLYDGLTYQDLKEIGLDNAEYYEIPRQILDEYEISLVREPENEFDSNAIAVYIKVKNKNYHIGYLSKELAAKPTVKNANGFKVRKAVLRGGPYRRVREWYDEYNDNFKYYVNDCEKQYKIDMVIELS